VTISVLTRLQKQDGDEDRSRVAAGREFQAARQRNCVIRSLTVDSAELSDHNVSTNANMSKQIPE